MTVTLIKPLPYNRKYLDVFHLWLLEQKENNPERVVISLLSHFNADGLIFYAFVDGELFHIEDKFNTFTGPMPSDQEEFMIDFVETHYPKIPRGALQFHWMDQYHRAYTKLYTGSAKDMPKVVDIRLWYRTKVLNDLTDDRLRATIGQFITVPPKPLQE